MIEISISTSLKGIRCLRATRDIKCGEVIEAAPVIVIPNSDMPMVDQTVLTKYTFVWDDNNEAVVLGYGSLYNHSEQPNVDFNPDYENMQMKFTALKDIALGEELYIDYWKGEDLDTLPTEYVDFLH